MTRYFVIFLVVAGLSCTGCEKKTTPTGTAAPPVTTTKTVDTPPSSTGAEKKETKETKAEETKPAKP